MEREPGSSSLGHDRTVLSPMIQMSGQRLSLKLFLAGRAALLTCPCREVLKLQSDARTHTVNEEMGAQNDLLLNIIRRAAPVASSLGKGR